MKLFEQNYEYMDRRLEDDSYKYYIVNTVERRIHGKYTSTSAWEEDYVNWKFKQKGGYSIRRHQILRAIMREKGFRFYGKDYGQVLECVINLENKQTVIPQIMPGLYLNRYNWATPKLPYGRYLDIRTTKTKGFYFFGPKYGQLITY